MIRLKTVKLHKKTLLTISVSVIFLIGVIFFASWVAVMGGFLKLERISIERNIARSQEVIADRLNNLSVKLADWSTWDDTYVFIEGKNEAFIKSNLTPLILDTLQLDMMLFFNSRGELVYDMCRTHEKEMTHIFSPQFKKQLDVLLTHRNEKSSIAGIAAAFEGPMLVASRPIVHSDETGPIRGTIVFASYLDAEEMQRFGQIIRAEMSVEKINNVFLPPDFVRAREAFLEGKKTFVEMLGAKNIGGYSLLKDISGKDVLILKVVMPREITQFGERTLVYFFIALVFVGCLFGVAVYVPLEREITGRDRAEKDLRLAEERYRELIEGTDDLICVVDRQGRFLFVNHSSEKFFGMKPEDCVGRIAFDFVHPDDRQSTAKAFEGWVRDKEKRVSYANRQISKKGQVFEVLWSVSLFFADSGEVTQIRGFARDITELKRAEALAGKVERKFQNLIETSFDVIWECDEKGVYTYVSPRIKDLLGYEVSEVLGRTLFDFMSKEEGMKIKNFLKEKVAQKEAFHSLENINRHKDGHLVTLETSAVPVLSEGGRVVGYRGTDRDISERKLAETYHEMRDEILQVLNESGDFRDAIRRVLTILKLRTGFDAVGMRLQDGDDFPYFGQEGFSKDFLLTENTLIERGADGGICRDADGHALLECTCGLVISGKTDPSQPFFTKWGSFWTNDSSPLLELSSDQDPRRHPRNQCIHQGYASIALVPLRMKEQIVGLLQFNDRRKGRFSLRTVELLENITEHIAVTLIRRKAEEALRESEKRFMDILYTAKDAILLIDGEKFIDCNEATAQMLGYSTRKTFLMAHPSELSPPQQPDGENSFEKANRMMRVAFERGFHRFEWVHRKADGTDFPVDVSLTPIVIRGKNILHCLWRDMTETKRLTEALKKSHENLENQVKERTAELVRSFQKLQVVDEELQRASKAKSEFLANMSHELRTPLNSIIGFSEVLHDERFGPLNERQKRYAKNVIDSGRHLLSLINDVLDLSKVEAGKMVLEASSFSLRDCIEEVLRLMESQAFLKEIKPVLEFQEGFDEVHGDPRKIKQVVYNLLSNAIKFTPVRGKVGIRGRRIEAGVEVTVWDTGLGISPENLEKAFGAFERLGNVYTQETEGTGLGLTISKQMVELHGGKIWIESEGMGKGTAVKFTIPSGAGK